MVKLTLVQTKRTLRHLFTQKFPEPDRLSFFCGTERNYILGRTTASVTIHFQCIILLYNESKWWLGLSFCLKPYFFSSTENWKSVTFAFSFIFIFTLTNVNVTLQRQSDIALFKRFWAVKVPLICFRDAELTLLSTIHQNNSRMSSGYKTEYLFFSITRNSSL